MNDRYLVMTRLLYKEKNGKTSLSPFEKSSYTTATAFLFLHGVTNTTHGFNVAFLTFYIKLAT